MHRFETVELGHYRGDDYFLTGFVDPEPTGGFYDPDRHASEYGVSVAQSTDLGTNVEIVRMDTAHGQAPHLDRPYLPPGTTEEAKLPLGSEYSYTRMKRYLLANWRWFVDQYIHYNE